jgi:hypothetical protein
MPSTYFVPSVILMIVFARCVAIGVLLCTAALFPERAGAQDLKTKLVVEIDRVETEIRETRWHLNSLEQKRGLERELDLLKKLYDRIVQHEGDLMSFECAGSTLDLGGGPPISTASSDVVGSLSQGAASGAPGYRFIFARHITDTEIRLLAQLVWIDERLAKERWHLSNLSEKKELQATRERTLSALRRVRNSRC